MHVVLAGGSGLIGTALRDSLLADGHTVTLLVRRAPASVDEKQWTPSDGVLFPGAITDAAAVICLSGAGVADRRWTPAYKRTLLASRVETVGTIARTIAECGFHGAFLAASAVGYYGDTGEREVDESAERGEGFLAELCEQWEAAAAPAVDAGARVAHLRTGIVLTRRGGLMKRLMPIVRLGVGGRLGSGKQFVPWISLADELSAIKFVLTSDISGPVNLTGPSPSTNAEFVHTLAHLMRRPAMLPVPAVAMKAALGELAQDALGGQRAVPRVLTDAGFVHQHRELSSALAWACAN